MHKKVSNTNLTALLPLATTIAGTIIGGYQLYSKAKSRKNSNGPVNDFLTTMVPWQLGGLGLGLAGMYALTKK